MTIYILLLLCGLALVVLTRINPKTNDVASKVYICLLAFLAMFRYDVGQDFIAYEFIFDDLSFGWDHVESEPGFKAVALGCLKIGGTAQLMFAVLALATISLLYLAYKWASRDLMLSLFVFACMGQLYMNCFNAVRQTMAIAFFYFALRYIFDKKFWHYTLCILLAASFHSTALMLFPLYWLLNRHWKKIIVFIVAGLLLASGSLIVTLIKNSGYSPYLYFAKFTEDSSVIQYLYLAMSAFIFLFSNRLMRDHPYRTIFLNLNSLVMICYICFLLFSGTPLTMVMVRMNYYFMFGYAVSLPAIIHGFDGRALRVGGYSLLIAALCFLFINAAIINGANNNTLPFTFNFTLF